MDARLNLLANEGFRSAASHLVPAATIPAEVLSTTTQALCRLRASQINGCGPCVDMHTKEAVAAGESTLRLNLVAVWREATVFTEAEKAALELTEEGTRLADAAGGVSDELWERAEKHYNEDELVALVTLIATINAFNRVNVITRQPAGDYEARRTA